MDLKALCVCVLCMQDVILPRVLDDQTFATINSIMLFNNVSVIATDMLVAKEIRVAHVLGEN